MYISACDGGLIRELFDDGKVGLQQYKKCNNFYNEFGELLVNFYQEICPKLDQITLDRSLW